MSPNDCDLSKERLLATISHAQCLKICLVLDQVREFLMRGSGGEGAGRSDTDLSAARTAAESRLSHVGVVTSALSTIGTDAELGHLAVSKVIRQFWGQWIQDHLANVEASLREKAAASFVEPLQRLTPVINEHGLFQRYLCDVRNQREHDDDVLGFLGRHLKSLPHDQVPVQTLHGQGKYATLAGVALLLGTSPGNARRVIKRRRLGVRTIQGPHGSKLYDLSALLRTCREANVHFAEQIPKKTAEDEIFFGCRRAEFSPRRLRNDPP